MKVLVTCPPMLGVIDRFRPVFAQHGAELTAPEMMQTLSVEDLKMLVPQHDGWIIGDDPATREVFEAGRRGKLKAAVKWGIGVDNVDFEACRELQIHITNTPNMFGGEVADIAVGYVIALARETYGVDLGVRAGQWPKPRGISLAGKTVALVGFGHVGQNTAKRLIAADMRVLVYDPVAKPDHGFSGLERALWPARIEEADFIVLTCALTSSSRQMVNAEVFAKTKKNVRVVNVARGAVVDELALEDALQSGQVYSAALDVFETEPLPMDSSLRAHPRCVFGSHNASNTEEAVERTSSMAIRQLFDFLRIPK